MALQNIDYCCRSEQFYLSSSVTYWPSQSVTA